MLQTCVAANEGDLEGILAYKDAMRKLGRRLGAHDNEDDGDEESKKKKNQKGKGGKGAGRGAAET